MLNSDIVVCEISLMQLFCAFLGKEITVLVRNWYFRFLLDMLL